MATQASVPRKIPEVAAFEHKAQCCASPEHGPQLAKSALARPAHDRVPVLINVIGLMLRERVPLGVWQEIVHMLTPFHDASAVREASAGDCASHLHTRARAQKKP